MVSWFHVHHVLIMFLLIGQVMMYSVCPRSFFRAPSSCSSIIDIRMHTPCLWQERIAYPAFEVTCAIQARLRRSAAAFMERNGNK